jgi:hypothetical protein
MRKIFLIISTILMLSFVACGSNSSKKGQELLNRILTLINIPQEIVVNICQDGNSNGFCDTSELQAKITIRKGDSADDIIQKIKFQANGTYLLENFDPTKKILMEIENNDKLDNTGQRVTLSYNPKKDVEEQELSILQSLVDNGFIKEQDIKAVRESANRAIVDRVLLENVFTNQRVLEENNLTAQSATVQNLRYIAEGLLDVNITQTIKRLDSCENNESCKENIMREVDTQTQIISVKTVVTKDGNVTVVEINKEPVKNSASEEEEERKTVSKNGADGYIIALSSPAKIICGEGKVYSSSLSVGAEGAISFSDVEINDDCNITIPADATIDSNNNGVLDSTDKSLSFEMSAPATASYITPPTTLLL